MKTNRFKNYGLWVAIASFIPLLLTGFGYDVLPKNYNEIVTLGLGIMVLAGIINDPTNGNGYTDK